MGALSSREEPPPTPRTTRVRRTHDADSQRKLSAAGSLEARYEVDPKVLGRGHYGVVRSCVNRATGERCAVKAIPRSKVNRPEVLQREIGILRHLKHPHIVEIRDVFEDRMYVYIVTELCAGGELFDAIIAKTETQEGHYSERDAATLIAQMLSALKYCHSENVVHRDLKPENFLFISEKRETLKIIDFGLATEEHCSDPLRTRVGTPYYIAPEVLKNAYTSQCDLWSLGVVSYILMCGYPPFGGDSDAEIFRNVRRGLTRASFPDEDWAGVSAGCLDFIKHLLHKDPRKRMTADTALAHPWLAAPGTAPRLIPLERLRAFVGLTRLRKAALNVLAHHLTEREAADLAVAWRRLDVSNKGVLRFEDLKQTLRRDHEGTEEELDALVRALDVNGDHLIDYYEFSAAMLARNRTIRDDRLVEVFEEMDADATGHVSLDNLERIMGSRAHAEEVLGELAGNDAFRRAGKLTFEALQEQLARLPAPAAPKPKPASRATSVRKAAARVTGMSGAFSGKQAASLDTGGGLIR